MPILKPGLIFVHIPKTAGTSIEVAAGFDAEYPMLGLQPISATADEERLFGGGLEHLSIREIFHNYSHLVNANSRIFSIVRDPVDRFVSHFVWRFFRFQTNLPALDELLSHLWSFTKDVAQLATQQPLFTNPRDGILFEGTAASIHPNDLLRHLLPQCAFLFDRQHLRVDYIYGMRDIVRVTQMLHEDYGLPEVMPQRMVGPMSAELRKHVPDNLERIIRTIYAVDDDFVRALSAAQVGNVG